MPLCKPSEQYLTKLRERYRQATKKQRGRILDEFGETTGYHRKHAIALLRGKRRHRNPQVPIRRPHRRIYLAEDKRAILWLADLFDQISSNRLRVAMTADLDLLRQRHHLQVSPACFKRLQTISPSTMDRFRRTERRAAPGGGVEPSPALCSNRKSRFAPLPIGMISGQVSRNWIWCSMKAEIPVVFSPVRWT